MSARSLFPGAAAAGAVARRASIGLLLAVSLAGMPAAAGCGGRMMEPVDGGSATGELHGGAGEPPAVGEAEAAAAGRGKAAGPGKGGRRDDPAAEDPKSPQAPAPGPFEANEVGLIPILEFHHFGEENGRWTLRRDDFRALLKELYDQGFRPVNLADVVQRRIDLPAGYAPVVLTFDDGNPEQFFWGGGGPAAGPAPESAVGILIEFHRTHPDWLPRATFFVNKPAFGPEGGEEKLRWLVAQGFEVGNHTLNHTPLSGGDAARLQREVGGLAAWVQQAVPGYRVTTLAYPNGVVQPDLPSSVWSGEVDGQAYAVEGAVLVGAGPAPSPYAKDWRPLAIPRIQVAAAEALENPADREFVWAGWSKRLLAEPGRLYASDGDPSFITVPPGAQAQAAADAGLPVREREPSPRP